MTSYPAGGIVPHSTQGTVFYSHDEAKILAETYYNIGNDLHQSLLPKLQTQTPSQEDIWRLYPAFLNLSFSCEIILKLFYHKRLSGYSPGNRFSILFVILFCPFIYFQATEKPVEPKFYGYLTLEHKYLAVRYI